MTIPWQHTVLGIVLGAGIAASAPASTLTDLLRQTLDNPGIAGRTLQLEAATDDASGATLRYAGQASVFAGRNHFDSARVVGIFTPGVSSLPAPVAQDITQYGIGYHLPVDVFGVIAAERELATANQSIAQLLLRQETLLRLHQTLTAYVRLQALAAQAEALQTRQQQLDLYARRIQEEVELGRTAQVNLSLVQSDLARLTAQQRILEGNRRAALAMMKASADATEVALDPVLMVPPMQSAAAQTSLPVAVAREQQGIAEAAAQRTRRSLLPSFSVDGQYTNYRGAGMAPHAWAVGLNMNLPLDPGRLRGSSAAMQRAAATKDLAQAVEADTLAQIATLEANYQAAVGNADALDAEIGHRRAIVLVEREKWQLGAGTTEALLYQERLLLETENAATDARAQAATAWSGMQLLLGTPAAQYIESLESKP